MTRGKSVSRRLHAIRVLALAVAGISVTVLALGVASNAGWPVIRFPATFESQLLLGGMLVVSVVVRFAVSDKAVNFYRRGKGDLSRISSTHHDASDQLDLSDRYLDLLLASPYFAAISDAAIAITNPTSIITRVSERRHLGDERSEVTVTRTVHGKDTLTAVPVLRYEKGRLVGSLKVTVDGKTARTLPFELTRGLIVATLYSLYEAVFGTDFSDLLETIAAQSISEVPATGEQLQHFLSEIERNATALSVGRSKRRDLAALRAAVKIATTCDLIFAAVDSGCAQPRKVAITYDEPFREPVKAAGPRLRRVFGLGRRDYASDLHAFAESRSYHLEATGPETMYVEEAYVFMPYMTGGAVAAKREGQATWDERVVVEPLRGDSHTHLYMRDMEGSPRVASPDPDPASSPIAAKPQFIVNLREKPPGILGPALCLALWIAVTTWVVGVFYDQVFPSTVQAGSAWPTVIFGVPALVTGWLLGKLSADVLRTISIPSFLLVGWVAANAAALVILSALKTTGVAAAEFTVGAVTVTHPFWAAMTISTALCLLTCFFVFVLRALRYASAINERVSE